MSAISSTDTNNNSTATGSLTGDVAGGNDLGKEEFLLLLVTQLQYQDPLDPMDDKEFIAQLAQFTALEQQITMTATMEDLVSVQLNQQMISAAGYIGREVSAVGYGISLVNREGLDDEGEPLKPTVSLYQYAIAEEMASGTMRIYDTNDQEVASYNLTRLGNLAPGVHDFTWDGRRSNGQKAADGVYYGIIGAKNVAGDTLLLSTEVSGLVEGVTMSDGDQLLKLSDGRLVSLSGVRSVLGVNVADDGTEKPDPEDPDTDKPDPEVPPEETPEEKIKAAVDKLIDDAKKKAKEIAPDAKATVDELAAKTKASADAKITEAKTSFSDTKEEFLDAIKANGQNGSGSTLSEIFKKRF